MLQRVLPERYTTDKARDMIGGVVGQLTLLLVLVKGLFIWTAYGVYNTQQTELQTIAARALEFDLEMRQYGPDGGCRPQHVEDRPRLGARAVLGRRESRAAAYEASYKAMGNMNKFLDSLQPKTPAQTSCSPPRARNYAFIGENRLLMSLQAETPIAWPLIYAVTSGRASCSPAWGLLSRLNPTTLAMLVIGAASVGLAIFLILEFSQPYTSRSASRRSPLEQAILELDQPAPPAERPSQ